MIKKILRKMFLYFLLTVFLPSFMYGQPTDEEIMESIESGVPWLVDQQQANGSWTDTERYEPIAFTGFALTKLCEYAYEHGFSPFNEAFEYSEEVIGGFDYLFTMVKTHGAGTGLCATQTVNNHHETYNAAVALMAIAVGKSPDRVISSTNALVNGKTFKEVQDLMVEYFIWSQTTNSGGGWSYYPGLIRDDNSHTGYVTLALKYAEIEGSSIPNTLKDKLSDWLDYIQDVTGGSGYAYPNNWVNLLKTGNLLFEFAFVGDDIGSARVQDALSYIETHWVSSNDPGYGDTQAMYCLMKGFESFGIDIITVGGNPVNWFDVFSTQLLAWQNEAGWWDNSRWTGPMVSTAWALMVLEKVAPPPNCPDDIVVSNDEGKCGGIVEYVVSGPYWAVITQTDGTGLTSGDEFPVGETLQEYTIDRGEGDVIICSFTVTVIDDESPVAVCQNISIALDENGEASITAGDIDNGSSDNCDFEIAASPTEFTCDDIGENTVTLTITDEAGNVDECEAIVTVTDESPPVITVADPITLWAPNHKYALVGLDDLVLDVSDNCGHLEISDVKIVKVTSDELENMHGNGDGNTLDDMVIGNDCMSVQLRKERAGTGNGRVYTVYLELEDDNENIAEAQCLIMVPHNKNSTAFDDGPVYEVSGNCGFDAEMENKSARISDDQAEIQRYKLTNYPNPFSTSTTIEFTIPTETKVMLKVFNFVGQEVITLVNKKHVPGTYQVLFDAAELPAGQYMYRLSTADVVLTKKMVLNR